MLQRYIAALSLMASCVLPAPRATAQACFYGMGDLPGGDFYSAPFRVSADGSTVVGSSIGASGYLPVRWTAGTGLVSLGDLPGGEVQGFGFGVSATGAAIAGASASGSGIEAFRWTNAGGMVNLGDIPGGVVSGWADDISGDGSVIAGQGDFQAGGNATGQAFRWTQATGIVPLGLLPGGAYSLAWAVSDDGGTIVGVSDTAQGPRAFRWTSAGGMVGLGTLAGGASGSTAYDVSADGATIVGGSDSAQGQQAFRWTQASGMNGLGDLPGGASFSVAYGVSGDGSVIVGAADFDETTGVSTAFIWDGAHGMRDLKAVLENDHHLSLRGWTLLSADSVSADGRTIAGNGTNPLGEQEGWVVRLGPPAPTCRADFNGDGAVNSQDFFDFLIAFFAGCP